MNNDSLPVEGTEILEFAYRMVGNAYFNRIGNSGKNRNHTTKHQPTDKVKKKARKNNRRAKRHNR
jgi:hypothetical protein